MARARHDCFGRHDILTVLRDATQAVMRFVAATGPHAVARAGKGRGGGGSPGSPQRTHGTDGSSLGGRSGDGSPGGRGGCGSPGGRQSNTDGGSLRDGSGGRGRGGSPRGHGDTLRHADVPSYTNLSTYRHALATGKPPADGQDRRATSSPSREGPKGIPTRPGQ
eukprot:gene2041-25041_t